MIADTLPGWKTFQILEMVFRRVLGVFSWDVNTLALHNYSIIRIILHIEARCLPVQVNFRDRMPRHILIRTVKVR